MVTQSKYMHRPATSSATIAAHCSTIRQKTANLDSQKLSAILDDVVRELKSTTSHSATCYESLNEIVLSLNLTLPPALISLNSHYFFILLRNTIQVLLLELHTKYQLNQLSTYVLRNCVVLLEYLVRKTRDVSKLLHWITDIAFVDALANCLYKIDRISKAKENERYIKQITRLLGIFIGIQERLPSDSHNSLFARLLQPVINCLTSLTYVQTFKDLKTNSMTLSVLEKLLLAKCPRFLATYHGPHMKKTIEQALEVMLPRYVSILDTHIKTINNWHRSIKRALHHLFTILVFAEGYFTSYLDNKLLRTLINHLLRIINESRLVNNIPRTGKNFDFLLVRGTLQILNVLVDERDALNYIKQCKPTQIFQRSTTTSNESILFNAYMILIYTTDENDLKHFRGSWSRLVCTVLNILYNATQSSDELNEHVEVKSQNIVQVTSILKSLVQHQIVRNEITKQNALPFIIESSQKLQGLSKQFILESLWILSFDKQIAQQMRDNAQFILSLQNIHKSTHNDNNQENTTSTSSNETTNDGVSQVADGLLWNIIKETEHRKNTSATTKQTNKYDIMISYCTKDKDIVNKIEEILVNEGFTIWLNRDTDNKQNMESIAEAIDRSTIIVCCVSESYRRDNRCVSESIYAYHVKRYRLPLIVQKRYKIDRWLSSIISRTHAIEFDVSDMKRSSSILVKEINHHCKKKISNTKIDSTATKNISDGEKQQTFERTIESPTQSGLKSVRLYGQQQQTYEREIAVPAPSASISGVGSGQQQQQQTYERRAPPPIPSDRMSVVLNEQQQQTFERTVETPTQSGRKSVQLDGQEQQTYERGAATPIPSGRTSVPLNVQQHQQDSVSRSTPRSILRRITPTPETFLLRNEDYLKYLPEEYTKRSTTDAAYHSLPINSWMKKDILDFLYDFNLILMMPLCESMTGRALLGFYQMCRRKPSRVHSQLNDELRDRFRGLNLPMGVYTQFLIEIDNIVNSTSNPHQVLPFTESKYDRHVAAIPTPIPSHSSSLQYSSQTPISSMIPPALYTTTKSMNTTSKNAPSRTTRIIERAVFRPASAAGRPYDFVVETGEESDIVLQQVERYAPQLFLLQQQAIEYRAKNGYQQQ